MKKHIFGFALFAFIAGGSIIIYLILGLWMKNIYDFVPSVPAISSIESITGAQTYNDFTIENIVADSETKRIYTKLHLNWNGIGEKPDSLRLLVIFYKSEDKGRVTTTDIYEIENPFINGDENLLTLDSPCNICSKENSNVNFYALVEDIKFFNGRLPVEKNLEAALRENYGKVKPILFNSGKNKQ